MTKINAHDEERIEDLPSVKVKVAKLKASYTSTTFRTGKDLILSFHTWKMDRSISASANWFALCAIRKDCHRFSGEVKYDEAYTWNIFKSGLFPRAEYSGLCDGFPVDMGIDGRLDRLDEKWDELGGAAQVKKEKSMLARGRQPFVDDDEEFAALAKSKGYSRAQSPGYDECFKCGSSTHRSISCPYGEIGFTASKNARIKAGKQEPNEEARVYHPPRPCSQRTSPRTSPRPAAPRGTGPASWRPRRDSSVGREAPARQAKARLANEDDSDSGADSDPASFDEFGGLSWDRRSEIPSTSAAADSGCTSHMTHVRSLFRSRLEPCRRSIQVGGGRLYSEGKGTATIKLKNGRSVLLEDTLYVPGMGCTLVSAKKLAGSALIGQFDDKRMLFSRRSDNVPLIEAKVRGGLYILSKFAKVADGQTFGTAKALRKRVESIKDLVPVPAEAEIVPLSEPKMAAPVAPDTDSIYEQPRAEAISGAAALTEVHTGP